MMRSNYEPPLLRLMWRLGLNVPPPHFASFWVNASTYGIFFGITWGAIMWFMQWSGQGMTLTAGGMAAATAGALFGVTMAIYYAYGKRKYKLPSWNDLQ